MPDAIALGELLIDFVSIEKDVALADLPSFAGAAGGAPANVAVGLSRLGVSAGFVGKVGDDPFGDFLRRALETAGVETTGLRTARGARTTLAFVATRTDGQKDITFYRSPGADMLLTAEEVSVPYLQSARLFHFGSVSLSRSPAREATMHAAHVAREAGLLVSYDPNWRPSLWDDPMEARGIVWEPFSLAHVVHCAEEEWSFITGSPGGRTPEGSSDLEAGAAKIRQLGPQLVVVTQGERGCYFDDGKSHGQVPGFAVEVVDPLGAGDAFVAAMLSRLMGSDGESVGRSQTLPSGDQLRQIMTYANAAGALACTKRGVIPALPTAGQVQGFLSGSRGTGA